MGKNQNGWDFELDAYGDPSWAKEELGVHKELRVHPTRNNWGAFELQALGGYDRSFKKRKLKEGSKEEVIAYLKKIIRGKY